ncbi:hypothetical protein CEXT_709461 [Caerostris extrusa]|uniref:Uncharacterized protein n=1 Tax=Caerostris extrusa TaxID=172846 RepID=A0AAV4Q0B1_CAEEX|nr:hypothetical protein CEXT_709461 [Caerostris extrusa]
MTTNQIKSREPTSREYDGWDIPPPSESDCFFFSPANAHLDAASLKNRVIFCVSRPSSIAHSNGLRLAKKLAHPVTCRETCAFLLRVRGGNESFPIPLLSGW